MEKMPGCAVKDSSDTVREKARVWLQHYCALPGGREGSSLTKKRVAEFAHSHHAEPASSL